MGLLIVEDNLELREPDDQMRLLVVEDNLELRDLLGERLKAAGFAVDVVGNVGDAQGVLRDAAYTAIVLDLGLPDGDGLAILRSLRARKDTTPVLVLTARAGVHERVAGLDSGADDYVAKPFAFEELLARLRALLRRPAELQGAALCVGNVVFDTKAKQVFVDGKPRVLPARERAALGILMSRSGRVVLKQSVENQLYGISEEIGSNALEVCIHRLRKQLAEFGANVDIHTIRGVGYLIKGPEQ
jgi:DNA-binding response OmpR family regulator